MEMEKMKFHWEDKDGKTGTFTVTALSVESCIDIANEEIDGQAELTDWYAI
jgi:hypothetical protein